MGRVKNGQVKNGQVKNELGQKWYIILKWILVWEKNNQNRSNRVSK